MPYKDLEKRREAIRQHYYANKESYIEKNRRRRAELKLYVNKIKSSSPCTDCNILFPYYVMDFDHLGGKEDIISSLIRKNNKAKLVDELKKCEVVCANCHRVRTFNRICPRSSVD